MDSVSFLSESVYAEIVESAVHLARHSATVAGRETESTTKTCCGRDKATG